MCKDCLLARFKQKCIRTVYLLGLNKNMYHCSAATIPRSRASILVLVFYPAKVKYEIPRRKYSEDIESLSIDFQKERKTRMVLSVSYVVELRVRTGEPCSVRTETNITEDEIQDCCNPNVQTIQHSLVPRSFPVLYACKLIDINTCLVLASQDLYDKGSHTETRGTMTDG